DIHAAAEAAVPGRPTGIEFARRLFLSGRACIPRTCNLRPCPHRPMGYSELFCRTHCNDVGSLPPVTSAIPRLLSLAIGVPPYALGQEQVTHRARRLFEQHPSADLGRLMPVFTNAGIERRYSSVPIEWYEQPHGWTERNGIYLETALHLLDQVARDALALAHLAPGDIDATIVVSTTGIATPSLDSMLIDRLGMRRDVRRLPVFGLGCAGGVLGMARAADVARAHPGERVLLLVIELCALSFRKND